MNSIYQSLEKLKQDLNSTYQNLARNSSCLIEFDDNLINNYFYWNQNIAYFFDDSSHMDKLFLKGFMPKIIDNNFDNFDEYFLLNQIRPSVDLSFCYSFYHDHLIHKDFHNQINLNYHSKINPNQLFDNFEKSRLIGLISDNFYGMAVNLLKKIEQDVSLASDFNLDLILLHKLYPEIILPNTKNFVENLISNLKPRIYQKILDLHNYINNQPLFSKLVKAIIDELIQDEELQNSKANSGNSNQDNHDQLIKKKHNFGAETVEDKNLDEDFVKEEQDSSFKSESNKNIETDNNIKSLKANLLKTSDDKDENKIQFVNPYKIYTNQFDEIIYPKNFIKKSELILLRNQLDIKISKLNSISKKMSLKLKRKLLAKKNNYFDIDSSGGILNRKKYSNLIISPLLDDIWINIRNHEYNNTALTILLDNSGSMRGNPIVMSALACQIIAEILEKYAIKTEIIGFTTSDWRGGRSRKLWEMSGRDKNPGRLNELRHIIYKSFNQSFKKSKINLGLMLQEGILKENIDGEALLFARSRLMQQNEKRKILMVISDGTPVDDSTTSVNDSDILTQHLRHVINVIEKQGLIQIIGIGIGHATDDFYKNSITIQTLDELGDVMIDKIINVL